MATRQLTTKKVLNLANDPLSGASGEFYYNTVSKKYRYHDGTSWTDFAGGTGGLSAVVDDTTPELGGNLDALGNNITNVDNLSFETTPEGAGGVATLVWDNGEGTLSLGLKGGNVNLQLGQENVALCYNGTGSTISDGSVVYITGAQGQRPSIALADADTETTSSKTFGIATESIANGAEGFVTTFGIINGVNTSLFAEGAALWLSSTAGQLTTTKPSSPTHAVFVGYCIKSHASSGRIFVNPQNGYEIEELHNVSITSIADKNILSYDSATSLWKNKAILTAITEVDGTGSGIDADLLDGQHGSYYAPIASPTFTGVPAAPTAAADTNTTQIATTAFVIGQGYLKSSTASSTYAPLASPTFTGTVTAATLDLTTAATATAATSYWVETGSDGIVRPKTLANVRTEIVTTAAVNSAAATTVGTVTSGTWNASVIGASYIDTAIARLASPTFTGTPAAPTAATGTNTTQIATTAFVNAEISNDAVLLAGSTMTGTLVLPAATTSISSMRLPHGSAPSAPTNGDIWTTTSGVYARINGSTVGPFIDSATAVVSDTAPTGTNGKLWYNSTNGRTFVYYQDGTSNQWVEVGTASIAPTGNYDGGTVTSNFGGISSLDGGSVT